MGPSADDVKIVMDAIEFGHVDAMSEDNLQLGDLYSNAAKVKFKNEDESISGNMTMRVDGGSAFFYGQSDFSNYFDAESGYTISGTIIYDITASSSFNTRSMTGELSYDMTLEGGKIGFLEVYLEISDNQTVDEATVVADGKEIDMRSDLEKVADIFDSLKR